MSGSVGPVHPSTPVLVGAGRYTFHKAGRPAERQRYGASPLELATEAARRALRDASQPVVGAELDSIAYLSSFTDAEVVLATMMERRGGQGQQQLGERRLLYPNPPGTVAAVLGCPTGAVKELLLTGDNGSMPQALISRACELIAQGELRSAMVVGAEALQSFAVARAAGVSAEEMASRWSEAELSPEAAARLAELKHSPGLRLHPPAASLVEANRITTESARRHGVGRPTTAYPLLENALRKSLGRTCAEQQAAVAGLFSGFTRVAAADPENAWFPTAATPAELGAESRDNRRVGHPFYLKRLNAVAQVDMSAALLVMSAGEAARRGVPREKWVFLHGCGEANDRLDILERPNLGASPAIRLAGERAMRMAGIRDVNKDFDFVDVYSCFPVAVEVACKELGIDMTGDRPLTVTGGLPYHGGPGSNYVTHSIAATMEKLRATPGPARALVTANGGLLTKHAIGVYANCPDAAATEGRWQREDPAVCQAEVDALPRELVSEAPQGPAVVETYCVRYGRTGPELVAVVGRLLAGPDAGRRFVANAPLETLRPYVDGDPIGARGTVSFANGRATFRLDELDSRL